MKVNGISMGEINACAAKHGLMFLYVSAPDDSADDAIELRTAAGGDTDIHIQLSFGKFICSEWLESEEAMEHSAVRGTLKAAAADAIARYLHKYCR